MTRRARIYLMCTYSFSKEFFQLKKKKLRRKKKEGTVLYNCSCVAARMAVTRKGKKYKKKVLKNNTRAARVRVIFYAKNHAILQPPSEFLY